MEPSFRGRHSLLWGNSRVFLSAPVCQSLSERKKAPRLVMSPDRLPSIGSSGKKSAAKPALSSPALQHLHQPRRRDRGHRLKTSSSSDSHPHPGPSAILLSDTTMTPWGGLALTESSFTSIPKLLPPHPSPPPPPTPPVPQPTAAPYRDRSREEDKDSSSSSFTSEIPSPPLAVIQNSTGGAGKGLQARRRRVLPQHRVSRPPRLPPLHPVTNLSFSRSFTFSFFELPVHQSPHGRAERIRNLLLLLKQIHY